MKHLGRRVEWLFFFLVLLLSTGAFAPLWNLSSLQDAAMHGNSRLQAVWIFIYVLSSSLLLIRGCQSVRILLSDRLLFLLTMAAVVSAAWSSSPTVTLRKAIALTGTTLVALLFAIDFDLPAQLHLLAIVLGATAIFSFGAAQCAPQLFLPSEFAGTAWNGVFSHKNLLGRTMALGALAFLSLSRKSFRQVTFVLSGASLCVAMLFASHSQTALVVGVAILAASALCRIVHWPWKLSAGVSLILLVCCSPFLWFAFAHPGTLALSLHRNATFTGRSRIWTFATLALANRPWLGHGFGAFWWISPDSFQTLSWIGYKTPHAHNGFLDLGLQLGILGLFLFAAIWILAFNDALHLWRLNGARETLWPVLYLLFIVFYSFTETSLLEANSILWILFVSTLFTIRLRLISTLHPSTPHDADIRFDLHSDLSSS